MSEMYKMKRSILIKSIAGAVVLATILSSPVKAAEVITDPATQLPVMQAVDPVDLFLSQSAFIGNSVGEGLTMYNNAMKKVPLGSATMLTRVSYSFYADANRMTKFLPVLNGQPMRAKDAIKLSGASYVFICMGTNDLVGKSAPETAFAKYQEYLALIMAENPGVLLFIESCTPTRPGSNVNNEKVTKFNAYMQSYCDMFPNMFYVDIATPLKDETGYLSKALTSDGSVHLTNKAYAIWANTIRTYITNFLIARSAALREQNEKDRQLAEANYRASMKQMEKLQNEKREARLAAEKRAAEAEDEKRREQLLKSPDEVEMMHSYSSVASSASEPLLASSLADATFRSSL